MVRKGSHQARAPAASQQQRQAPQNKRGRGRTAGASQQGYEQGLLNQHAYDQQTAAPCLIKPAILCDLGMALQRMGVLPVLPAASERKLAISDPMQSAHLQQLNTFLDHSYELQQRGHLLWVAEQKELQRGADLAIISPPTQSTDCPETQAAHFIHQQTPIKVCQGVGRAGGSPTDVLMSPQTASTLLAAAMASQGGLSPSMTGSAAAQLLSPSALGFAPLLLQDLPHNQRRRLGISSHSMMSPNGTTFNLEAAGLEESCHSQGLSNTMHHHMDDDNLMPTSDHGFGHHMHDKLMSPRSALHGRVALAVSVHPTAAGTCPGLPATSDLLRTMREHLRQQQHGARTPRGMMLPSSMQQPSPLSPADLLVTGACPQGSCMDHGLIGAYAVHHHGSHLDCDLHAELRVDAGGPHKRARR